MPHSVGQGSSVAVSCGIGHRHGSDPLLLWLWCRPADVVLFQLLAWELPYATGMALKKTKINKTWRDASCRVDYGKVRKKLVDPLVRKPLK